jgi:hypothetical protein
MDLRHIAARIKRLDALFLGLQQETALIAQGDAPLLYLGRQAYLRAVQSAAARLENGWVVLAKARQRIERGR